MKKRLYLAYGSNLSTIQMACRCPDAEIVGTATIKDYRLMYKGSLTGSYATIEPEEGQQVPVLVWAISARDERSLDRYEGYPTFYYKKELEVEIIDHGKSLGIHTAMVYIMDERRENGIPSGFYENILREGYREFGFNEDILDEAMKYSIQNINSLKTAK